MAQQQAASPLSIRPSSFAKGGGLVNDIDATITTSEWVLWDYKGKIAAPVIAAHVVYKDDAGEEHDAYYTAGQTADFQPSRDNKTLMKVGKKDALNDNSNFAQFMGSVVTSLTVYGLNEDYLPDGTDISFLEGWRVHVLRETQPKREGLKDQNPSDREKTVLCISRVIEIPGQKKGKPGAVTTKAATGGKANGQAAAAATGGDDLADIAAEAIVEALGENDGQVTKAKMTQLLFSRVKTSHDTKTASAVVGLALKPEFLNAEGQPWTFDGTNISLG